MHLIRALTGTAWHLRTCDILGRIVPPQELLGVGLLPEHLFTLCKQLWEPMSFLGRMTTQVPLPFFVIISSLCTDRLETANRQLSSREYDGHEDRAAEGLYASQSESPRFSVPKLLFLKAGGLRKESC